MSELLSIVGVGAREYNARLLSAEEFAILLNTKKELIPQSPFGA